MKPSSYIKVLMRQEKVISTIHHATPKLMATRDIKGSSMQGKVRQQKIKCLKKFNVYNIANV